jgi:hypothetical protein
VQLAYFGAYFLLAMSAAFIDQRFGYKTGILTGLGLAALGALLFYPAYQRSSSKALWGSPVLLSIAHGEAMSPEFQEGFYDAVFTYVRARSADSFADDLEDAVSKDKLPPR